MSVPLAVMYVVSVAAVGLVRFDIGAGFTVPTQAVFVPMLFALPTAIVPLLVALSLALGMAPSGSERERAGQPHADRAVQQLVRGRTRARPGARACP